MSKSTYPLFNVYAKRFADSYKFKYISPCRPRVDFLAFFRPSIDPWAVARGECVACNADYFAYIANRQRVELLARRSIEIIPCAVFEHEKWITIAYQFTLTAAYGANLFSAGIIKVCPRLCHVGIGYVLGMHTDERKQQYK